MKYQLTYEQWEANLTPNMYRIYTSEQLRLLYEDEMCSKYIQNLEKENEILKMKTEGLKILAKEIISIKNALFPLRNIDNDTELVKLMYPELYNDIK